MCRNIIYPWVESVFNNRARACVVRTLATYFQIIISHSLSDGFAVSVDVTRGGIQSAPRILFYYYNILTTVAYRLRACSAATTTIFYFGLLETVHRCVKFFVAFVFSNLRSFLGRR